MSRLAATCALLLLLAALGPAGCSLWGSSPEQTPAQIVAAPGQRFTIELDANPSTGFQWELDKPLDTAVVTLVETSYEQAAGAGVGAGGKEIWTFDAVAPGWTKIQLRYRRPWEEMAPAALAVYSVDVR